jgi:hypothetical protein
MNARILYSDQLVEITDESILLRGYYFPFGSRRIRFSEILGISVNEPTIWNGKYRIYGSGDLRTWFPPDVKRPVRDKIFVISLKNRWRRIGFTVEDSAAVEAIMQKRTWSSRGNARHSVTALTTF